MENEEENDMCEWDPLLESDAPVDTFSDSGFKKECLQPHDTSTDSKESSQTMSSKEGKTLLENGGEIGYQKGGVFISMTNFAVVCTGFVIGHENAKKCRRVSCRCDSEGIGTYIRRHIIIINLDKKVK